MALFWKGEGGTPAKVLHPKQVGGVSVLLASLFDLGALLQFWIGVIEWNGDENALISFIVSLNLTRRHLSESQRAMIAASIANMRQGEKKDDLKPANLRISQPEAAQLLNVSRRTIQHATKGKEG